MDMQQVCTDWENLALTVQDPRALADRGGHFQTRMAISRPWWPFPGPGGHFLDSVFPARVFLTSVTYRP